ncbi:hypothetical protein [Shuttleworthella satelles]|uniref:Uncharacterized protein n=1 Tax=Shuttleworthella satelles DSM 14600 TaxID=626523 RepID=C4G8S7_9FIRM|nr:hypothetical protein [Shuttleworthia satelles]EEP29024.1 hypothetical protein GCWU000342_00374 [Shuttleworthia satelles DSM 14600]
MTTSGRLALAHISRDTATAAALAFYRRVEQEGKGNVDMNVWYE